MGKSRSQKKCVYTFNLKKLVRLGKSAFTATVSCRSRIKFGMIRHPGFTESPLDSWSSKE